MKDFILSQMDYIYFIYGLAFIMLYSTIRSLNKAPNQPIAWMWLGVFALLHGTLEWSDLTAYEVGDTSLFKYSRLFLMVASYWTLMEFARVNSSKNISALLYIPLLSLILSVAVFAGASDANALARYLMALFGCLSGAYILLKTADSVGEYAHFYKKIAFFLAAYGIAAGFIVPAAGFFPANIINHDSFLNFFSIPIQLVRAFCAVYIAWFTWRMWRNIYAQHAQSMNLQVNYKIEIMVAGTVFAILVLGWLSVESSFDVLSTVYDKGNLTNGVKLYRFFEIIKIGVAVMGIVLFFIVSQDELLSKLNLLKANHELEINLLEHRQAEEELQNINEMLETRVAEGLRENREKDIVLIKQSRLAAMGEMMSNIAHQWRQPLNVIALEVQDVKFAHKDGEINEEYIQNFEATCMQQVQYLSTTIDTFSHFFSTNTPKEKFEVTQAVRTVSDMLNEGMQESRIRLEFTSDTDPVFAYGHKNEFGQVILNLLLNAKDALLSRECKNPKITISVQNTGEKAIITVADNGGGIRPDIIDKIFDPYFTTKHQSRGVGIALFMAKMLIEQDMQGVLSAKNDEEGAVFTIEIASLEGE